MLRTIQIIAILQGLFLILVLLKNKKKYKSTTFWLFFGSIASVLLYLIGDDGSNIFKKGADWFLFDSSLFVTFLLLFLKYFKSGSDKFSKKDYLFFIPNIIFFSIEATEIILKKETVFIEIVELLIAITFLMYVIYIVYDVINTKGMKWVLYFVIPIGLIKSYMYVVDSLAFFGIAKMRMSNNEDFNKYLLLIIAFLFYFVIYNLITKPIEFLPKPTLNKYKTSGLKPELIKKYEGDLIQLMEEDKLFLDPKLSIVTVSEKLNIPRQYISEVLNLHMNISFQDFVNNYRVNEFIKYLQKDQYAHYTLFGIANEVGFNSKSSFNATFKKIKGVTPTEFKQTLVKNS
ncbi:AraC family transcriptional regulator [Lutibacter sp. B1]|uniref:helix-turn-helix domain-containing protein n=1 Tax=Lutibacter sp. B1 TaxID=2725996 RepID=UPI001457376A|nr:helix-turn-helix domain-containing protein [Lutibacter sp. B1]NLP58315.1 AraC family transcriptional regulator [Lutibacter sp. B1]